MSDAAETLPDPVLPAVGPPPPAPVTARSEPQDFLFDADRLALFVDKLRASGVKTFKHPSGLEFTFEQTRQLPIRPTEGW